MNLRSDHEPDMIEGGGMVCGAWINGVYTAGLGSATTSVQKYAVDDDRMYDYKQLRLRTLTCHQQADEPEKQHWLLPRFSTFVWGKTTRASLSYLDDVGC